MSKSLRKRIIRQLAGGDKAKEDELSRYYGTTQLQDLQVIIQKYREEQLCQKKN